MNTIDTLRIAFRESDGNFQAAWVEDIWLSPNLRESPLGRSAFYRFAVFLAIGKKDEGGAKHLVQRFENLGDACRKSDGIVDEIVGNGKNPASEYHGFADRTGDDLTNYGIHTVIFSVHQV